MNIVRATIGHSLEIARMFDLYRQFYDCDPDPQLARSYITERIRNKESSIFIAEHEKGRGAGFVQMYPSFCSVEAVKILILYDLFTDPDFRRQGVGRMLMNRARDYAKETGARRLDLLTAKSNIPGQNLYESLGYVRINRDFHSYSLNLSG